MATIIEHDIQHDSSSSSALTAFVAIIAIVIVASVALYMLRLYPFSTWPIGSTATPSVNVNIKGTLPNTVPLGQ